MIILKPSWVNHDQSKPIFSVDIHPNGGRFATGGQGGSGGRIVIWNIGPVLNENEEFNSKIPKMLCQMDNHLACVNVVRWSNAGHLLASGSDDKLVMIWRLTNEGSSSVFGSGQINVETWKCIHTLNSHNGDVLDIAWAPHDGWLASGSVDNSVIIWNAQKFPEKVAVLKNHTGMVKGVTWDPVDKYIASQSDDKSLRIWRTSDWTQQEVVTDPFNECSATTHVLRLSWSPDGQYLVSAHAMNGGGPTAQIIEREGWKQDKDFVGHRKAVTCVRFNSNILKKQQKNSPKPTQYCCCAIGSRDRSISVWLTSLKRPLVVIKDLFDDSVLDMSWSSNGLYLMACSWDGSVACVIFTQEEIGTPLTMDEKNELYEKMYHKSFQKSWNLSFSGSQIIENPELLGALEEKEKQEKSNISIEIQDPPQPVIPQKDIQYESPKPNQNILVPQNKQLETRLPSGKRRITPMMLTPSKDNNETSNQKIDSTSNSQTSFSKSSPSKSQIIIETVKPQDIQKPQQTTIPTIQQSTTMTKVVPQPPSVQINQLMCCEVPGDEPIVKFINVLDPLKLAPGVAATKECGIVKLQMTNNCHKTPKGSLSKIEVFKNMTDKDLKWDTYLGSSIRCLTANRKLIVVCCEDLTINCFEIKSGARPLPPILIEDLVSSISLSQEGHCLVLTKTGLIHMWDLETHKNIFSRISIRSLLTGKGMVNGCSLGPSNQPVITLTDGRAYAYSVDLKTWVQVSNPLDPVCVTGSNFIRKVPMTLPLASMQRCMASQRSMDTLPPGVTLSFLESQITATGVLESSTEYKYWLFAIVNHLLEKGPECRLRVILDDLMGPTHKSAKKPKVDQVMGMKKRKLLNEILGIIKTKLPWQRLYKEYSEQVNELQDDL
ncbi:protein HIRA homolog isoform X1 [Diorhabda carinulata]|uniref:protein HIRA homolog isoform X1 n=1 Tax=Diorhabda carinulata TaxID=1163345 RepID=UPI0025A035DE|nr:protein HIRA homolog isoform X1 [Diorhabda carinulata]